MNEDSSHGKHAGDLQLERKTHLHKKLPTYQCIEIQWIDDGNEQTILPNSQSQLGPEQCRYAAIMISWPLSKLSLVRSWTHFSTSPTVQTSRARRGHSSSFNHSITLLLSEWMTKLFSEGPVRLCGTDIATCPFGLQKDPEPLTCLYFWPEPCYTRFGFTKLQRLTVIELQWVIATTVLGVRCKTWHVPYALCTDITTFKVREILWNWTDGCILYIISYNFIVLTFIHLPVFTSSPSSSSSSSWSWSWASPSSPSTTRTKKTKQWCLWIWGEGPVPAQFLRKQLHKRIKTLNVVQ